MADEHEHGHDDAGELVRTRDRLLERINSVLDANAADRGEQARHVCDLSRAVRELTEAIEIDGRCCDHRDERAQRRNVAHWDSVLRRPSDDKERVMSHHGVATDGRDWEHEQTNIRDEQGALVETGPDGRAWNADVPDAERHDEADDREGN